MCAVTHKYNCCSVNVVSRCISCKSVCKGCIVCIGCKERSTNGNLVKLPLIFVNNCHKIIIFKTAHNVCRLNYKLLNAVINKSVESLFNIVDSCTAVFLDNINYDLACKCTSYFVIRVCLLDRIFNCTDRHLSVIIKACTKAYR